MAQEMLTRSGTHAITPFGEFVISPIHCIYTLLNVSVLGLCLRINDWFVCLDESYYLVSDLHKGY